MVDGGESVVSRELRVENERLEPRMDAADGEGQTVHGINPVVGSVLIAQRSTAFMQELFATFRLPHAMVRPQDPRCEV